APSRTLITDACLLAAQQLAIGGKSGQAFRIFERVYRDAQESRAQHFAALAGMIAAQPSACAKLVSPLLTGSDAWSRTFALRFVRETVDMASAREFARALNKLTAADQVWMIGAMAGQENPAIKELYRQAVLPAARESNPEV